MDKLLDYVKVYDDALVPETCERFMALLRERPDLVSRNGKGVYDHLRHSSWDELNLNQALSQDEFADFVKNLHKYKAMYEEDCGIKPALPMPDGLAPLTIKQYRTNGEDGFEPHYDSAGSKCPRYLVWLYYLNDVEEGGETHFVDLNYKVSAKQGRLLIFPPFWMYRHEGCKPISNDKFILSTYYMWWK